jgi:ribonuclease III
LNLRIFKPVRYYLSSDKPLFDSIKNIFGFYPRNIYLYKLAFLHRSAGTESSLGIRVNNERLEYLGDAVLDLVAADYLFKAFPLKDEGFLTEMRSKIVSRNTLNKLAIKMGLDLLVLLDPGSSNQNKSFRGDALEAFIGAMYLDRGYQFSRHILIDRILRHYFNLEELVNQETNFKSKLIEWVQRERKQVSFNVVEEVGTGYRKQYVVEVIVDGVAIARGLDFSIKGAEQNGAEKAWGKLNPPEGLDQA